MSVTVSNNNLFQVEKLTNSNFTCWKFRLQMVLKARKLWKYVDGSVVGGDARSQELDQDALSQIALTVSVTDMVTYQLVVCYEIYMFGCGVCNRSTCM